MCVQPNLHDDNIDKGMIVKVVDLSASDMNITDKKKYIGHLVQISYVQYCSICRHNHYKAHFLEYFQHSGPTNFSVNSKGLIRANAER